MYSHLYPHATYLQALTELEDSLTAVEKDREVALSAVLSLNSTVCVYLRACVIAACWCQDETFILCPIRPHCERAGAKPELDPDDARRVRLCSDFHGPFSVDGTIASPACPADVGVGLVRSSALFVSSFTFSFSFLLRSAQFLTLGETRMYISRQSHTRGSSNLYYRIFGA